VPVPALPAALTSATTTALYGRAAWDWRSQVCKWLVGTDCPYVMAWGVECEQWHDECDVSVCERFDGREVPEEICNMTTWHNREPMEEVFWFCKVCATHDHADLASTLILHVADAPRGAEILASYHDAA
jgi:hypothetical protein